MNIDEFEFRQFEKKMFLAVKNYNLMKRCAINSIYFQNCAWYKKLLWIIIK